MTLNFYRGVIGNFKNFFHWNIKKLAYFESKQDRGGIIAFFYRDNRLTTYPYFFCKLFLSYAPFNPQCIQSIWNIFTHFCNPDSICPNIKSQIYFTSFCINKKLSKGYFARRHSQNSTTLQDSPSKILISSNQDFLGTRLSTTTAVFVKRQPVLVLTQSNALLSVPQIKTPFGTFIWWTLQDSNLPPPHCKWGALPDELRAQKLYFTLLWTYCNCVKTLISKFAIEAIQRSFDKHDSLT